MIIKGNKMLDIQELVSQISEGNGQNGITEKSVGNRIRI